MIAAVIGQQMTKGFLRTSKIISRKLLEDGTDTSKVVILTSIQEMNMDDFYNLFHYNLFILDFECKYTK